MKRILAQITHYKLQPENENVLVQSLETWINNPDQQFKTFHIDEIKEWINALQEAVNKDILTKDDREEIMAILHQIERLLAQEIIFSS